MSSAPVLRDSSSLLKRRFLDRRDRPAAAFAVAILMLMAQAVQADVRVKGDIAAVQVDASRSNVGEVLSALESAFRLRVKTSIALDKYIAGTFSGSLTHVLPRILDGYNYFIRLQATEIEVTVLGQPGDRAATAARPRLPPNPAISLSQAARLKNQSH